MSRTVTEICHDMCKAMTDKADEFYAERKLSEGPMTKDDEYGYLIGGLMHAVAVELEKLQR